MASKHEALERKVREFFRQNGTRQKEELRRLFLGFSRTNHKRRTNALAKEKAQRIEAKLEGA